MPRYPWPNLMYGIESPPSGINLQATLSASSAMGPTMYTPHHPITCGSSSDLQLFEDGSMSCDHATVAGDDPRVQNCINHSIAILLFELVNERFR